MIDVGKQSVSIHQTQHGHNNCDYKCDYQQKCREAKNSYVALTISNFPPLQTKSKNQDPQEAFDRGLVLIVP
eukprot:scaffold11609_cov121-Skeletonema_marinoi.AAC.1